MDLPEKFLTTIEGLLKEEYEEFFHSYENDRMYGIRVNTSKITIKEFEAICPFPIKRIPWIPNGYFYDGDEQPAKHPYYYAGLYYLQEPSAMTPASRLPITPGERVLDLCAAPGGKATELGVRLQGKGVLVANDVSISRARALLKNIELFGISNVFVVSETPERLLTHFEGYFDKILIDAPCSGEGMFRKDPSVIKNWERLGVEYYVKLQRKIVTAAAKMLRPGGMVLYSTCTFSPEEDERMVQYLLEENEDMTLVKISGYEGFSEGLPQFAGGNEDLRKCVRIWPHKMSGEGHFMALLQKREGFKNHNEKRMDASLHTKNKKTRNHKVKPSDDAMRDFNEFMERVERPMDHDRILTQGDKLYYMTEELERLTGMRFLRNGLYLGELKKKRFEPSQAFAMTLKGEEYDSVISFDREDRRVIRYLKGESLDITGIPLRRHTGWQLVCVDGYPLGWGKLVNGTLKNKYQVGWRWL